MKKSVQVQAWYLSNLLLLPGISFLILAWHYYKLVWIEPDSVRKSIRDATDLSDKALNLKARRLLENSVGQKELDQSHSRAAFWLSIIGGSTVLGGCSSLFFFIEDSAQAWTMIIVTFTILHTSFVMWGMVNLAQAMSSRLPYFKIL